jgi:anti-sigma B factor antagonist
MPLNIRIDENLAILSNFGRLLNDPKHFDASRDLQELLDQGHRNVVLELGGIREMGSTSMGLLMTLTRLVRQHGGEVVLANASHDTEAFLDMMGMDVYWDLFESVDDAKEFFRRAST